MLDTGQVPVLTVIRIWLDHTSSVHTHGENFPKICLHGSWGSFLCFCALWESRQLTFHCTGACPDWGHKCDTVLDDGGSGVCWAIRPSPVPAGAQVSSGCRGWAPGCCRQQGLHRSEDKWLWSLLGLWPLILSMGSVNPLQLLLFKSSLFTSLNLPPMAGLFCLHHTLASSSRELWCFPWWPQRFMCCWGLAFPMSFCLPLQCLWHSGMCPQGRGWRHWGLQEHCDTSTIWNRSDRSLLNYD